MHSHSCSTRSRHVARRFWRSTSQQRGHSQIESLASTAASAKSYFSMKNQRSQWINQTSWFPQRQHPHLRSFSSSSALTPDEEGRQQESDINANNNPQGDVGDNAKTKRLWRAYNTSLDDPSYWSEDVVQGESSNLATLLDRIEKQELASGRMRTAQHGVLHEDPVVDMRLLTENYTVSSLASALRDREDVLQFCAQLAENNDIDALKEVLSHHHPNLVLQRRSKRRQLDVTRRLNATSLENIRKALMRMPRRVTQAHTKRAGVVICLCHVNGVPSILLEKRSASLRVSIILYLGRCWLAVSSLFPT
jgi:hypothetical protein